MGRPANTRLSDDMSGKELSDTLGQMVFTAARDWQRSVTMTRGARDMIVAALRKSVEQTEVDLGVDAQGKPHPF